MFKSYKYRIYPNSQQINQIEHSFGVCRLAFNLALQVKIEAYKSIGKQLSGFDLCYQLVDLKKDNKWMYEVDCLAIQGAVKTVEVAFKKFFLGYGFPRFKKKSGSQSYGSPINGTNQKVDFINKTITVPKIKPIKAAIDREFTGRLRRITISRTASGKYFASVLVEESAIMPMKPTIKPTTTIGIDLGIKSYLVTSNGAIFEANRHFKKSLSRLKILQRRASKKVKGSKNRKKAFVRVAKLHEKVSNQRADYIHKITTGLIRDNQAETFVIEDLNVVSMLQTRQLAQSISDVSFGEFKRQMQYKCDWYGKNLIKIGRFEPSSKTCSTCGAINETLTLKDREWSCATCGTLHDRDVNAAKNIRQMGLNKHSGEGIPGEPVENRRKRRSKKQENIT